MEDRRPPGTSAPVHLPRMEPSACRFRTLALVSAVQASARSQCHECIRLRLDGRTLGIAQYRARRRPPELRRTLGQAVPGYIGTAGSSSPSRGALVSARKAAGAGDRVVALGVVRRTGLHGRKRSRRRRKRECNLAELDRDDYVFVGVRLVCQPHTQWLRPLDIPHEDGSRKGLGCACCERTAGATPDPRSGSP